MKTKKRSRRARFNRYSKEEWTKRTTETGLTARKLMVEVLTDLGFVQHERSFNKMVFAPAQKAECKIEAWIGCDTPAWRVKDGVEPRYKIHLHLPWGKHDEATSSRSFGIAQDGGFKISRVRSVARRFKEAAIQAWERQKDSEEQSKEERRLCRLAIKGQKGWKMDVEFSDAHRQHKVKDNDGETHEVSDQLEFESDTGTFRLELHGLTGHQVQAILKAAEKARGKGRKGA